MQRLSARAVWLLKRFRLREQAASSWIQNAVRDSFGWRGGRVEKFFCVGGLGFWNFNAQQGRGGNSAQPVGGIFIGEKRVKTGGFEARARQFRLGEIKAGANGDEVHLVMNVVSVLESETLFKSAKTMMPAPV